MPRRRSEDLPEQVAAVVEALRKLAAHEGMTRTKVAESEVLRSLATGRSESTPADQARRVEELIRIHVNSISKPQDRALLSAGLNLDGQRDPSSYETRIINLLYAEATPGENWKIESDGAIGRFRSPLLIELAWRLLGGSPTYASPEPPSNDLEVAQRLRVQRRASEAVPLLRAIVAVSTDERESREAWRLLGAIAYEQCDYDQAEAAYGEALNHTGNDIRGGDLATVIDRFARQLTDEEQYDRALAIVDKALKKFYRGRWLWRRRGCVQWYAGNLLDAHASLSYALTIGYPASRVFHARGQVMAELGWYKPAIYELEEVIRIPRSALSIAKAQSGLAFAQGMSGDLPAALATFARAEQVIPDSGWLHYWRALCFQQHGLANEAASSLERAVKAVAPRVPSARLERALPLIKGTQV